jgi:hypothetical protein
MPLFEIVTLSNLKRLFPESPFMERNWEGIGNYYSWLLMVTIRNRSPIHKSQKRVFDHTAIFQNSMISGSELYQIRDIFGGIIK